MAALAVRGQIDGLRGEAGRAWQALAEAERAQRQATGAMWTAPVAIGRAETALWARDPHEAARMLAAELATYAGQDDYATFVAPVMCLGLRAEADVAAGARAGGEEAAA